MEIRNYDNSDSNYTPGSFFFHSGTKYIVVSCDVNFCSPRCAVECINTNTGLRGILFADEIDSNVRK